MKNVIQVLTLILFFQGNTFSQDKISYKILKDSPSFFIHIKGGLLADTDFKKKNLRAGYFITANVNLIDRIFVGVDFATGIEKWNKAAKDSKSILDKSMLDFSGRGTFFFSSNETKENVKIVLKSDSYTSGNYRYTNEKYFHAPATFKSRIGLTASAGFYRNTMTDVLDIDTLYRWENNTNQAIEYIDKSSTYFSGARFSGGIHFSKSSSFKINATNSSTGETYGTRNSSSNLELYIEALFMPIVAVNKESNLKDGLVGIGQAYTLTEKPDIMNFGYRIKVEGGSAGLLGIGYRLEIGQRPGIKTSHKSDAKLKNLYAAAGIFISINK